jgi:hypothetical protein
MESAAVSTNFSLNGVTTESMTSPTVGDADVASCWAVWGTVAHAPAANATAAAPAATDTPPESAGQRSDPSLLTQRGSSIGLHVAGWLYLRPEVTVVKTRLPMPTRPEQRPRDAKKSRVVGRTPFVAHTVTLRPHTGRIMVASPEVQSQSTGTGILCFTTTTGLTGPMPPTPRTLPIQADGSRP